MKAFFSSFAAVATSDAFSFFGSTFKRSVSLTVVRAVDFDVGGVTGGDTVDGGSS